MNEYYCYLCVCKVKILYGHCNSNESDSAETCFKTQKRVYHVLKGYNRSILFL